MEEVAKYEAEVVSLADVKKYIAPKATDKELFMFMGICKAYGLNPMKREIHFIKYGESAASIVVGYETYLKRAEKTGKLDGWEVETNGKTATIKIRRKDWKEPFIWTVEKSEFDKGQANWKTMPNFMLKKIAISQGFRLAFPVEMGGMPYIPEEISSERSEALPTQTEEEDVPCPPVPKDEPPAPAPAHGLISDPQRKRFYAIAKNSGKEDDEIKAYLKSIGIEHTKDIPKSKYEDACKWAEFGDDEPGADDNAQ